MSRPRLSLCMIVRNEQEMLPGLLAGVAGLWDEFIAADTGSSDATRELLEQAGATVITHPWADDFAAARNASLAAATGRWILFLDADERVTPGLKRQIRELLDDGSAGAATVVMRNVRPDGSHDDAALLRLFRNDPSIRFRHRIHEDVQDDVAAFLDRETLVLRHLDGVVEHLGYVREVAASRHKRQRDQDLLQEVLTADPDDFYCWFKLLESARFWGDHALWTQTATAVAPLLTGDLAPTVRDRLRRSPWSGELAALVSQGLGNGAAAALDWLERWRDRVHTGAAWHLRHALLLEELDRRDEASAAFERCVALAEPSRRSVGVRARLGLCRLAAAGGDLDAARVQAQAAAAAAPTDPETLLALVKFTELTRGPDTLAAFVTAHQRTYPGAGGPLAEALLRAGRAGQAYALLAELVANEPVLALGLLTCALALGREMALEVDLDQDTADTALRRWVRLLWDSRQTRLMTEFAANSGSVQEVFPWLADFLAAETRRLQGS